MINKNTEETVISRHVSKEDGKEVSLCAATNKEGNIVYSIKSSIKHCYNIGNFMVARKIYNEMRESYTKRIYCDVCENSGDKGCYFEFVCKE